MIQNMVVTAIWVVLGKAEHRGKEHLPNTYPIRKIFETQQETYENSERISLVSSFMTCLFLGAYACIDAIDGAGMNLMDIKKRAWSKVAVEATALGLEEKLGKLAPAHAVAGSIASYFAGSINVFSGISSIRIAWWFSGLETILTI
ncbi:hypothetical protein Gotur_006182 [Gossypium turneri]